MHNVIAIARRELTSYFLTPLAYIFIVIFLAMAGTFTFFVGNFFGCNSAGDVFFDNLLRRVDGEINVIGGNCHRN